MKRKLRPYQDQAAQKLAERKARGLWAGAGLGKTATLLEAVARADLGWPVLIVTRAIGRHVWARDAAWVLGDDFVPGILWAGAQRSKSGAHRDGTYTDLKLALTERFMIVTNYEVIAQRYGELSQVEWSALILDEAHAIKGGHRPIIKRRDGTPHYTRYHYTKKIALQVQSRNGPVWQLTATPIRDRRSDLWSQLDIAYPGEIISVEKFNKTNNYLKSKGLYAKKGTQFNDKRVALVGEWKTAYHFLHRYCGAKPGKYGGLDITEKTNTEELETRLNKDFIRISRDEVADQLPKLSRDVRMIELAPIKKARWGGGVEDAFARAAEGKIPQALELMMSYLESEKNSKVIVICNRRILAGVVWGAIQKEIKKSTRYIKENIISECITGEIEAKIRIPRLTEINEAPRPVALSATMDCLRESIDLHYFDSAIVIALPYRPGDIDQFEGRFARLGGKPCTIHYLVGENCIDEKIRETLLDKLTDVVNLKADTANSGKARDALKDCYNEEQVLTELRAYLKGEK